jgi:multidrug resistance protein, MATE family
MLAGMTEATLSSASRYGQWRGEFAATIELAVPIALTQLGQIAMMTTDLALIGRLGDQAVAAAALGHTILFTAFMLCMGLASAVAPLASQAVGARDPRMVRRSVRVGLWAVLLSGVPLTLIQLQGGRLLEVLGQEPEAAALADRYLAGIAWTLVPGCAFIALRNFMSALDRPQPALWITLLAIPANGLLAYALIHGVLGLPALDLLGAGLATSLINLGMCVATLVICHLQRPFRKFHVLANFWRADWRLLGKLTIIGLPISGAFLLEYGLFAAAAMLMGWIGTAALVGHQIALQIAAIVFMVPLGVGMAATVRVGQATGRRDPAGARRAGFAAIVLGMVFMAAMAALVVATRHAIPMLFLGNSADAQTVALTATLLLLGATFFIADGTQTIAAGALRGLNDTRVPLLFAAGSFWIVGFMAAYALGFPLTFGAAGVWAGLSIGIAVYAALLVLRFHLLMRRSYLPAVPGASA